MDANLRHRIESGEIDINNSELFFSIVMKSLLYKLNHDLKLRDKYIPHMILNTGDDTMWVERRGYDHSKEPLKPTNEDNIYNSIPRAIVDLSNMEVLEDQLSNPHIRGNFDLDIDGTPHAFSAEMRRLPIKMEVGVKYYLDTFQDTLSVAQQIMTKLAFVQTFKFVYMGYAISASYKIPTSFSPEKNITFDGGTTDSKNRTIDLSLEIETNLPVYNEQTVVEAGTVIKHINDDTHSFQVRPQINISSLS